MRINLIPVLPVDRLSPFKMTTQAIENFRPYVLSVAIVVPIGKLNFAQHETQHETILSLLADVDLDSCTVISIFREPKTIGMLTGFLHLKTANANVSRAGENHQKEFLDCLSQHQVVPNVLEEDSKHKTNQYTRQRNRLFYRELKLDKLTECWERFIINTMIPMSNTSFSDNSTPPTITGTMMESWAANDN